MATNEQPLAITGLPVSLEPTASVSYTKKRDAAIADAQAIKSVLTPDELEAAVKAKAPLADILKAVEKCRKTIKDPILAAGRAIDAKAKEFTEDVAKLNKKLADMINGYQTEALLQQEAREKEAREKLQLQAREIEETLEQKKKKLAELMDNPFGPYTEIERLESEILEAELTAEVLPSGSVVTAPAKVEGVSTKLLLDFEIKGRTEREKADNLYAFVQAYPHFCNITIRRQDVLDELNKGKAFRCSPHPEEQPDENGIPNVPGLHIFRTAASRFK